MLTIVGMGHRRIDAGNPESPISGSIRIHRSRHGSYLVAPAGEATTIPNAIFEGELSFPIEADGSFSADVVRDENAILEVSLGAASGYLVCANYPAGSTVYFDQLLDVLPDPVTQVFYVNIVDWANITNKPTTFPASVDWTDITNKPTTFPGSVDWTDITNKPDTFPASVDWNDITNKPTLLTSVTKADVGLGNVDNTSDANKPVSTATQNAINALASSTTTSLNNKAGINHATMHSRGASDAVTLTNLASGSTNPVARLSTAGDGSLSWSAPLFTRKNADQQFASNALTDVVGMVIPLEANATYVGSADIGYFTGATSVKMTFGWTIPAGATMAWTANGISSAASTVAAAIARGRLTGAQSQNIGSAGAALMSALPSFIIRTGATAGSLQLQAAQAATDAANPLTVVADSWMKLERVA